MSNALPRHARPLYSQVKWIWAFGLVSTFIGALLFVVPPYFVIGALLAMAVGIYLLLNPDKCYYLLIFTIPLTERVRVLPVSFSPNDLMVLFTTGVVALHIIFRSQQVSLRTRLDVWLLALTVLYMAAGVFSESSRGILGSLKFVEAVFVYYLTVYFIRTKQVKGKAILITIFATAACQAALGVLQSFSGKFGADFMSQRGYLGYLGLGSSTVWHGKGTMEHFNGLGNFLCTLLLFFLPIYWFILRNKNLGIAVAALLLIGIITTYSRGSLLGLMAGGLVFLAMTQPTRQRAITIVAAVAGLVIVPLAWKLGTSSYAGTLSFFERLTVWQVPLAAIRQSAKTLWLGSGLNAYDLVGWPYIPANIPMSDYKFWFPHNYYLLLMIQFGLIGTTMVLGFFSWLLVDNWRAFRQVQGYRRGFSLSLICALVAVFFVSIFDHSFSEPYFNILLFLLLGVLYVKPRLAAQSV